MIRHCQKGTACFTRFPKEFYLITVQTQEGMQYTNMYCRACLNIFAQEIESQHGTVISFKRLDT